MSMCLRLSGFCSYTTGCSSWVENGPYPHSKQLVYYWRNRWGLEEAGYWVSLCCWLGLTGAERTKWLQSLLVVRVSAACWWNQDTGCLLLQGMSLGSGMRCGEAGTRSSERGIPCIASTGQKLQGRCLGLTERAVRNPDLKVWCSVTGSGPRSKYHSVACMLRVAHSNLRALASKYYSVWLS